VAKISNFINSEFFLNRLQQQAFDVDTDSSIKKIKGDIGKPATQMYVNT